eukprot:1144136-Pelagomonas_calceolata.AAC.1
MKKVKLAGAQRMPPRPVPPLKKLQTEHGPAKCSALSLSCPLPLVLNHTGKSPFFCKAFCIACSYGMQCPWKHNYKVKAHPSQEETFTLETQEKHVPGRTQKLRWSTPSQALFKTEPHVNSQDCHHLFLN